MKEHITAEQLKKDEEGNMTKITSNNEIEVKVTYFASEKPYKEVLDRNVTVKLLKEKVLSAFGLTEGQTNDGNSTTYTLYHDKAPLENTSQTIGDVAGDKKELHLKLSQQVTQGLAE